MKNKVEEIIKKLALTRTEDHLFNPYNQVDTKCDLNTAPGLRQNNLRMYLNAYNNNKVKEIWVTEYIDTTTKISGVPLIAPAHFYQLKNILNISALLEIPIKNSVVALVTKLNSVWSEIESYETKPLVWNTIPFYLNRTSDRKIKMNEHEKDLMKHAEFLYDVIDTYRPETVYALSKQAQEQLSLLKVTSKLRVISD